MSRWSNEKANAWWAEHPWICGFNYLPSTSVNFLEMWHPQTFDRPTIERELGWAGNIGFNAVRFNLSYLVWKHDRDGLLERLHWLIDVAGNLGIASIPCIFDDCGFGGQEPGFELQPDPVPGVHNSRAVASPGRDRLFDRSEWDGFREYVRDVISAFRNERRVLFWDLYNEPGNRMIFEPGGFRLYERDTSHASMMLLTRCFDWARSQNPSQPLSVAAWMTAPPESPGPHYEFEIDRRALELSDIVTFHAYTDLDTLEGIIRILQEHNRPLICTEWMARPIGSRITDLLPTFAARKIGCVQWGLVKGRTQTYLPWPLELVEAHGGRGDRTVWFHDLIDETGQPYDLSEVALIGSLTLGDEHSRTASDTS